MNSLPSFKKSFSLFALTFLSSLANAKMEVNSICYISPSTGSEAQALNTTPAENKAYKISPTTDVTDSDVDRKFEIASLSKAVTTAWAIATLGPEYRFKTAFHISAGKTPTSCNIHIQGDMDPFLGRESFGYMIKNLRPKLAERNCNSIEFLTYDENFKLYLEVLDHQKGKGLKLAWRDPRIFQNNTKANLGLFFAKGRSLKVNTIEGISKTIANESLKYLPHATYTASSVPLYQMLKEMNKFSHNYSANVIFDRLGGPEEFKRFVKSRYDLNETDLILLNGSGYPVGGIYNKASCSALVTILRDLDGSLYAYKGTRPFTMADIMGVAGNETYSTFNSAYSTFKNRMTAKTGTANPVISFAGTLSTTEGMIYFAALTHTASGVDQDNARTYIRKVMSAYAKRYELKSFNYTKMVNLLPYDSGSILQEVNAVTLPNKG